MKAWLAENWLALGALAVALAAFLWNVFRTRAEWRHAKEAKPPRIKVTVVHRADEYFRHPSFPDRLLPRPGALRATVVNVGAGDLFLERPYFEWRTDEDTGRIGMSAELVNPISPGDKRVFYLRSNDDDVIQNVPDLDKLSRNAIHIDFCTPEGRLKTVTGDEFVWLEPEIDPKSLNPDT